MVSIKVQKTKNDQYIITIPKALVEALDIGKGAKVDFKIINEKEVKIIIK